MISPDIPWQTLFYIFLLLSYTVISKNIQRMAQIPAGLLTLYFLLCFLENIPGQYSWSSDWLKFDNHEGRVVLERQQKKGVAIDDFEYITEKSKKFIETIKTFFGVQS